jgi:hypothetical protein
MGAVHNIENWEKVLNYFEANEAMRRKIRDYHIELQVYAQEVPIRLGDSLKLKVVFLNRGEKEIPSGTEFLIVENDYFYGTPYFLDGEDDTIGINDKDTKVVEFELASKNQTNPEKLPLLLEVSLSHPKIPSLYCSTNAIQLTSDLFLKDLTEPDAPPIPEIPYYNILLFGVAGSGKSSFINSVLTTVGKVVSSVAAVGGGTNHVTRDITRFKISQIPGLEKVILNFFDIWGLDANNFQKNMLLDVLNGILPEGYLMKDRTRNTEQLEKNCGRNMKEEFILFSPLCLLVSLILQLSLMLLKKTYNSVYQITV